MARSLADRLADKGKVLGENILHSHTFLGLIHNFFVKDAQYVLFFFLHFLPPRRHNSS